jgi:hypothetical protein
MKRWRIDKADGTFDVFVADYCEIQDDGSLKLWNGGEPPATIPSAFHELTLSPTEKPA